MKHFLILLTLFLAISPDGAAQSTNATNSISQLQQIRTFLFKQLPNPRELFTEATVIAIVDVALSETTRSLGENPNAKLVLRDFGKYPGIVANVLANNEVAGTGYDYDSSHLVGHTLKVATKLGGILFLVRFFGWDPGDAAVLSNIPGDSVGRFFLIAGEARQDSNSSLPFWLYSWSDFDSKWIIDTISKQAPNLPVMHMLGNLAGAYAVGPTIRSAVLTGISYVLSHNVAADRTLWGNLDGINSNPARAQVFAIMTVAYASEKAFFNLVFQPISRIMMALGSHLYTWIPTTYDWVPPTEELIVQYPNKAEL